MGLDYSRMKKGIDIGDNNVVFANGDNDPYSQTGSGAFDITNADLTAMGIGSEFTNNATGEVWRKIADTNDTVADWVMSSGVGGSGEDAFQNTFMGKTTTGSEYPTYSSTNVVTAATNPLESAIGELDAEIGAAVVAVTRTNNNPISDQAINLNIDALDEAIGADADLTSPASRTAGPVVNTQNLTQNIKDLDTAIGADITPVTRTNNNPTAAANSSNANIDALDAAIGSDADIANTNFISQSSTVGANLSALDGQVSTNTNAIAALEVGARLIEKILAVTSEDLSARTNTLTDLTDDTNNVVPALQNGDRLISTHANADDKVWVASDSAWTSVALVEDDAFFAAYDLPDEQHQEGVSLYKFDGSTVTEVADFDFETAGSIGFASFTAGNGTVGASDTVQSAVQKLVGNQDDIQTTLGVAQGDTEMGVYTGTIIPDDQTAKQNIQSLETDVEAIQTTLGVAAEATNLGTFTGSTITDGSATVKSALQELETAYEETDTNVNDLITLTGIAENTTNLGTFTGSIVTDSSTIKTALQELETELETVKAESSVSTITTEATVDSVLIDNCSRIVWEVSVRQVSTGKTEGYTVYAQHDGNRTAAEDATEIDSNVVNNQRPGVGTKIVGLVISVDLNGTTTSQVARLRVASTAAVDVKTNRLVVDSF